MLVVFQQPDMEQTLLADVERHKQRLTVESPLFYVDNAMLYVQRKRLYVHCLHGITLFVHVNACKQRRMGRYGFLYGRFQFGFVQATVQHVQVRQVVAQFSLMGDALGINAMLHF